MTKTTNAAILNDPEVDILTSGASGVTFLRTQQHWSKATKASNVFVFSTATGLPKVSSWIREANGLHKLRGLFVRMDIDQSLLLQMFDRADLRTLRNAFLHSDQGIPRRILSAWSNEAQGELIATAALLDRSLLVVSCDLKRLEVPIDQIPGLRAAAKDAVEDFRVDHDGSYVEWPQLDHHLDLRSLRSIADPALRERLRSERLQHNQEFGKALRRIRREHGINQSEINGISARQVGRIENGQMASMNALHQISQALGISTQALLDRVATNMSPVEQSR